MEKLEPRFSDKALRDFQLIDRAILDNDQEAYAELMQRHKKSLYYMILKMVQNTDDADDLSIEAFAKAFKHLAMFKKQYTFSTWLFRIASNNTIDFIRKKKLKTYSLNAAWTDENGDSVDIEIQDKTPTPDQETIKEQKRELIRMFVDKLPERYQLILKLRYFKEYSYLEIAKELDIPLGTIKAQLFRAKELMYELMKDKQIHI